MSSSALTWTAESLKKARAFRKEMKIQIIADLQQKQNAAGQMKHFIQVIFALTQIWKVIVKNKQQPIA